MQLVFSTSTSPTFNLAAEEFLFSACSNDYLFLYVNEPSVIVGSNQVLRNEVNTYFCMSNNIQMVRRMSGGGAVYHDFGNLNYCFIANRKDIRTALNSDFLLPVVRALKALGVEADIGVRKDVWLPGGFKISGTASHVTKSRELHHGTLLFDTDLEKLQQSLTVKEKKTGLKGIASVASKVKNIRSYLYEVFGTTLSVDNFFDQMKSEFLEMYHQDEFHVFSNEDFLRIKELEAKYKSVDWTYKK